MVGVMKPMGLPGRRRRPVLVVLALAAVGVVAAPGLDALAQRNAGAAPAERTMRTPAANSVPATVQPSPPSSAGGTLAVTPAAPAVTSRTLQVPLYYQAYSLSCESASLRMALAYQGINVTDAEILAKIPVDGRPPFWDSTGLRWGDPYTSFVGDVSGGQDDMTGYGTYYPTIVAAATALGGKVLAAGEGISPERVYDAVLGGHPVVAWVTYEWANVQRSDYTAYDGRMIAYVGPFEHAVTVIGVTPTQVYVNNPDFGLEVIPRSLFESAYATFNNMAVILA
jgi:uncharacterized protein YvpB